MNMSNEQADVVKQLSGMLQYQPASVVSRVLLKNKGGTVTLFAFSKGEGLSEHTAPFDALVHVIEGEAEIGIAPRRVDDAEIVDRLVLALVNEGARLLEEGIAARASDVDVVYLTGYGFPRARGGPMFYADQVGLDSVLRRVREFARNPHGDPAFWTPAPLLARLAGSGRTFVSAT